MSETLSAEEAVAAIKRRPGLTAWYEAGEVLVARAGDPGIAARVPAPGLRVRAEDVEATIAALSAPLPAASAIPADAAA